MAPTETNIALNGIIKRSFVACNSIIATAVNYFWNSYKEIMSSCIFCAAYISKQKTSIPRALLVLQKTQYFKGFSAHNSHLNAHNAKSNATNSIYHYGIVKNSGKIVKILRSNMKVKWAEVSWGENENEFPMKGSGLGVNSIWVRHEYRGDLEWLGLTWNKSNTTWCVFVGYGVVQNIAGVLYWINFWCRGY